MPAVAVDQDRAGLGALIRPDDAELLHLIDDTRGARITQLDTPLQRRNRALLHLEHRLDRLRQHLIVLAAQRTLAVSRRGRRRALAALAVFFIGGIVHVLADFGAVGIVGRAGVFLDEVHDVLTLFVRDKGALNTTRLADTDRAEEHIAHADQLLGAALIEDDTALHRGRDREGNAAGDIGLHQTGDNVSGRALRGYDQVDTGGAAHLSHTADALFNLF